MAHNVPPIKSNNLSKAQILLGRMFKSVPKTRKLISVFSFAILMFGGGLVWKLGPGQKGTRELTNYTIQAESGKLPGLISASGELKAKRSVNISPEKQGVLAQLYVIEGDTVEEGQLLAEMKSGDYLYRLKELKADYEKQKAAYKRRKGLFIQGAISAEDHEEYLNRFLKSEARLRQTEVEGSELKIRAPFDGVITARYAEPGAFVTPTSRASSSAGSTSTSIVELSQGLEVVAKVPESDIGRIRINQIATIRVDAFPDQNFQAQVSEIAPRAIKTNNVASFEVTLIIVKPPNSLRIGMTADVNFQAGETDISTLVPTVAIVTENGDPGVLIVGKGNQPEFQKVELGTSSGDKTSIITGIQPGERIFIDLPPWSKRNRD